MTRHDCIAAVIWIMAALDLAALLELLAYAQQRWPSAAAGRETEVGR